ncbi:importin-9-like [Pollicipes pollicipes]|uniref:importin-9-like n=1 Tax=Pollicipes pollicipes TaxID=41117 RepID=UPI0018855D09|nr:importin-9-like [Pollicipes pollicipes]
MGDEEVRESLKEALLDAMGGTLSPLADVRKGAEERLKALEVTDEYGRHLSELTLDVHCALPMRQLASVMLRQYVDTHWTPASDKFQPPEPSEQTKTFIRQVLPLGLKESISKVRASVAYALSSIAHWDWPEQWPELFDILMACLKSGDEHAVHGAMRVLTEFSRDLTDAHVSQVAPVLLAECYRIFVESDRYSIRTRSRAVEIFHTCAALIATVAEYDRNLAKSLLVPVLPKFTEALVKSLSVPYGCSSDSGLKMEVLKTITMLVKNMPKHTVQWMGEILAPVWSTLTSSAVLYVRSHINDLEEHNDPTDSDGQVLSFENLVYSIFDFVTVLVETPKFRSSVKQGLDDLVYYIIVYGQITEEQIATWSHDPNQFVEDEDEETFSYSVRVSARDLLVSLCREFEDESIRAVCTAISRHMQEAALSRQQGHPYWWKIHESCMQAIIVCSAQLLSQLSESKIQFDLMGFLENVVVADLRVDGASPFLLGQCLVTASRFGAVMNVTQTQSFLQATVTGLLNSQPPVVRTSALRAIIGFCEVVKEKAGGAEVLRPFLGPIVDNLITFIAQYHGGEVLALMLEAMCSVVSVDKTFTATYETKITPLAIAVFLKYNKDPVMVSLSQDIFRELSKNEQCLQALQSRLVPTLLSILNQDPQKLPGGLQAVSLDVLQTLIRSSTPPLSELLISEAFPVAVRCVMHTDDNSTMQSGGECLRAYVSVATEQVCAYRDSQARSGLWYLIQVCTQLLSPTASEFSAAFVGRLLMVIVSRLGDNLGNELETLLRATLSKMVSSQTTIVIQSLIMVYAHLVNLQLDAVLSFLSSVPGPTGQSALHFLLTEWCSRQHLFYGSYDVKVSVMAMCKLLQHGVNTHDSRLNEITVRGDEVISSGPGMRTRSQRAREPEQWTSIPVLVKIFKLLINELSSAIERDAGSESDPDEEYEDEAEEDQEKIDLPEGVPLSQVLSNDFHGYDFDTVDDEEDADALADPVYHVDLKQYLSEYLASFCQQPCIALFAPHLQTAERQVLSQIGVRAV